MPSITYNYDEDEIKAVLAEKAREDLKAQGKIGEITVSVSPEEYGDCTDRFVVRKMTAQVTVHGIRPAPQHQPAEEPRPRPQCGPDCSPAAGHSYGNDCQY